MMNGAARRAAVKVLRDGGRDASALILSKVAAGERPESDGSLGMVPPRLVAGISTSGMPLPVQSCLQPLVAAVQVGIKSHGSVAVHPRGQVDAVYRQHLRELEHVAFAAVDARHDTLEGSARRVHVHGDGGQVEGPGEADAAVAEGAVGEPEKPLVRRVVK